MNGNIVAAGTLAGVSALTSETRWPFIDHAYCLTLATRCDRQKEAVMQLAGAGLLPKTSFIISQPATGPKPPAILASHCQAARDAAARGYQTILILEDDVTFLPRTTKIDKLVERTMTKLPGNWHGLYLGHFPLRAYFVAPGLLRTSSGCSHAYIASQPLLKWLGSLDPAADLKAGRIKLNRLVGQGIDAALACRPNMYACFPMVATQGRSPSSNIDSRRNRSGKKRHIFDKYRYSALAIRGMRAAECIAVFLSPLHYVTRRACLHEAES